MDGETTTKHASTSAGAAYAARPGRRRKSTPAATAQSETTSRTSRPEMTVSWRLHQGSSANVSETALTLMKRTYGIVAGRAAATPAAARAHGNGRGRPRSTQPRRATKRIGAT